MRKNILSLALILLPSLGLSGPDLSGTTPILTEDFSQGLNRYDGRAGLWSTLPRRKQLMTNAAQTVFMDNGVLDETGTQPIPDVHALTDEGLALRTVAIPDGAKPALQHYMAATKQGKQASKIRFATGVITTAHTWAQTYGYFEIEARIPRGKGRWPAFWLTFAGIGWPPEIDVFEAYGSGFDTPTKKDNRFNTAVFFDALDADRKPTHSVDIENPYADPGEEKPLHKKRGELDIYNFRELQDAKKELGADIYRDFHTYAALWTPEHVIFYFGKDRDNLAEIYRTPTPEDVNAPMFLIANDQFTARGGWWPANENELDQTLDPQNALTIRRIEMHAFVPEQTLNMAEATAIHEIGNSVIHDTPQDDVIAPGAGFDIINLSGGADHLILERGRENKIISGFGPDDRLTLEGYPFEDSADAMSRLTQVGDDVWLPSGADPAWPHTVIFRNTTIDRFDSAQVQVRWPVAQNIWRATADRRDKAEVDSNHDGLLEGSRPGAWLKDEGKPVHMIGTPLTDRFMVSNPGSDITEPPQGGVDTLISWVAYTLPPNVEVGIARGQNTQLRGTNGDDRLEAEGRDSLLAGGRGNDLYVITKAAQRATIQIEEGDGHDLVRGLSQGDRIDIAQSLRNGQKTWQIKEDPRGVIVLFGPEQSLILEHIALSEAQDFLSMP